jgi:hypothetical protein
MVHEITNMMKCVIIRCYGKNELIGTQRSLWLVLNRNHVTPVTETSQEKKYVKFNDPSHIHSHLGVLL